MKRHPLLAIVLLAVSMTTVQAGTFTYDEAGRLTQVAYPNGQGIRYGYDDGDNLTSVEPITVPKAPSELSVVRTSLTSASLQWEDEGTTETGFTVQRRLARNNQWTVVATVNPNSTSHVDDNLDPDENYVYRIRALGTEGDSAYSDASVAAGVESVPFEIISYSWVSSARIKVDFATESGATYNVETSQTLMAGSWLPMPFALNPAGEATSTSLTATGPATTVYFDLPIEVDRAFFQVTRLDD